MNKSLICMMILLGLLTGCSDSNKNNLNVDINNEVIQQENKDKEEIKEKEEDKKVYTEFTALGKVYKENKDIKLLNNGDLIYHDYGSIPYVEGEYKEVDFGLNLLTEYLAKNEGVYDFIVSNWDSKSDNVELISGEEKENLIHNVNFLGEQFGISEDAPIYFKIDKVILQEKLEDEVVLEFRGYLSKTNGNFRPLGTFTVNVYTKENKLYGYIL